MSEMKATDAELQDARKSWATVAREVWDERVRQLDKWGVQRHADLWLEEGFSMVKPADITKDEWTYAETADWLRDQCDLYHDLGEDSWDLILLEEVFEALAEDDHDRLRAELVQVAAVVFAWIDDLDSREVSR